MSLLCCQKCTSERGREKVISRNNMRGKRKTVAGILCIFISSKSHLYIKQAGRYHLKIIAIAFYRRRESEYIKSIEYLTVAVETRNINNIAVALVCSLRRWHVICEKKKKTALQTQMKWAVAARGLMAWYIKIKKWKEKKNNITIQPGEITWNFSGENKIE